ncbi:MAG: hypothetical protein ACK5LO_03240 [Leucobacter sp.]
MTASASITLLGDRPAQRFECSRAGCREAAEWALVWRNPRIHSEDRRKTWLACAEHLETLRAFLADRGFPLEVRSVGELDD